MKHLRRSLLCLLLSAFSFQLFSVAAFSTDVSITAASVKASSDAVLRTLTAGEAITAGQLVYRSTSTFKILKADCDSATANVRDCYGIAVSGAAGDGAAIIVCLEDPALILGGTTANGTVYCLSATAGGVAPLADITTNGYVTVIGVGSTTTAIAFRAKGLRSTVALP